MGPLELEGEHHSRRGFLITTSRPTSFPPSVDDSLATSTFIATFLKTSLTTSLTTPYTSIDNSLATFTTHLTTYLTTPISTAGVGERHVAAIVSRVFTDADVETFASHSAHLTTLPRTPR